MPQCRKAIRLAALFHIRELLDIELLIADGTPVVVCVVHGKARSECPVGSNNQPVLSASAPPVLAPTAHEPFVFCQRAIQSNIFQPSNYLSIRPPISSSPPPQSACP